MENGSGYRQSVGCGRQDFCADLALSLSSIMVVIVVPAMVAVIPVPAITVAAAIPVGAVNTIAVAIGRRPDNNPAAAIIAVRATAAVRSAMKADAAAASDERDRERQRR